MVFCSGSLFCSLLLFVVVAAESSRIETETGLGGEQQTMTRQTIQLYNAQTKRTENLPPSFIAEWPTWVLDVSKKISRIPDSENDGFVNPSSIEEMWQAVDLKYPQMNIALGFHIRDGVIQYVMPALDLSFDGGKHRNRGLCSLPRAYGWVEFNSVSSSQWAEYELIVSQRKKGQTDWQIVNVFGGGIEEAVNRLVILLATDPPDDWKAGSHVVNVVLETAAMECTRVGHDLGVLLKLKQDPVAHGTLLIKVAATKAGSESEFLPEVYKDLFQNELYQRKEYFDYKERRANMFKKENR